MTVGYPTIPDGGVQNFTTDFRSGIALAAILHRFRPNRISWKNMDFSANNTAYRKNLQIVYSAAKLEGIADLMDIEDYLILPRPDAQCVITQLSEYYKKFGSEEPVGSPPAFEVVGTGAGATGAATKSKGVVTAMSCARCGEAVMNDEDYVEVGQDGQARLHKRCFNCYTCGKEIRNAKNAVFVGEGVYCDACGRKAFIAMTLKK